jgi:hypothetical protein
MSARKKSNLPQSPISPEEERDTLKIVYKELSEQSRYYDTHIWQIPSVTVAVNAFLIGQAFSDSLQDQTWVQALVVFSAAFFTFVLLIALVKHRLHKSGQDANIRKIEKHLKVEEFHHLYQFPEEIDQVEKAPNIIVKILSGRAANTWLMSVLVLTVLVDLAILALIVSGQ